MGGEPGHRICTVQPRRRVKELVLFCFLINKKIHVDMGGEPGHRICIVEPQRRVEELQQKIFFFFFLHVDIGGNRSPNPQCNHREELRNFSF